MSKQLAEYALRSYQMLEQKNSNSNSNSKETRSKVGKNKQVDKDWPRGEGLPSAKSMEIAIGKYLIR